MSQQSDIVDLPHLMNTCCSSLLEDVVPFWIRHSVDRDLGGIMTCVDRRGKIVDTDKLMWQQCRWAWLLGELYNNVEQNSEWLELCLQTAEFITRHGFDPTVGRLWFHLSRDGRPVRKRRYAFSESFDAIALGEIAKATGKQQYADLAIKCFQAFISHDPTQPPEYVRFTVERQLRGIGGPMITIGTAQQLLDSIQMPEADQWIDRSIDTIRRYHLKPDLQCVMEAVQQDGEISDHFDGRTLNPGHAIEAAWFIMAEGHRRNDAELVQTGCRMLDWMWQRGWDSQHGGLLYFVDLHGGAVQEYWHDMKFWWPQCEAVVATLYAFLLTNDPQYGRWCRMAFDWFHSRFADPEHGEYFGYLHRDGRISSELKGNHWKGPFHIPRMQLMCWKLIEQFSQNAESEVVS
jgi:N-acylglucosamine 2-epimerase